MVRIALFASAGIVTMVSDSRSDRVSKSVKTSTDIDQKLKPDPLSGSHVGIVDRAYFDS